MKYTKSQSKLLMQTATVVIGIISICLILFMVAMFLMRSVGSLKNDDLNDDPIDDKTVLDLSSSLPSEVVEEDLSLELAESVKEIRNLKTAGSAIDANRFYSVEFVTEIGTINLEMQEYLIQKAGSDLSPNGENINDTSLIKEFANNDTTPIGKPDLVRIKDTNTYYIIDQKSKKEIRAEGEAEDTATYFYNLKTEFFNEYNEEFSDRKLDVQISYSNVKEEQLPNLDRIVTGIKLKNYQLKS